MARPSKYKEEFVAQAEKLCVMGFSDEAVAFFFDADLVQMGEWASEHPAFLAALSPSEAACREYRERVAAKAASRAKARAAASTPSKRMRAAVSSRMWSALKPHGSSKGGALFDLVGYSKEQLVAHLESLFSPGMAWDNYGAWHVDHRKPCALFDLTDNAQFAECWALANLQPLWAADNIRKGAKYASA
jgi:hypothetical protein